MNKKKMSQVRLIKPTEDEAASLGPRVLRGEKDMKTIQGRLDLVKRLEKEISELELSIAISEQKLANVEAPSLSLDLDFEI
jgi:hypothetical protein